MAITWKFIKRQFAVADMNLEFCWQVLTDMKRLSMNDNDFVGRFIIFQERLAETIFDLQSIRNKIIKEEKAFVQHKNKYNSEWFKSQMRRLSTIKDGIDSVVDMAKAFGDAFAYFFYQNDIDLLSEHYTHQRIINHAAGNGELGELEFIKRMKHIDRQFTIYHGITNILRYGDFSFIDLNTLKLTHIGELKTSHISGNQFQLSLSLLTRSQILGIRNEQLFSENEKKKDRFERQIYGIAKFLRTKVNEKEPAVDFLDKTYSNEVDDLIHSCCVNGTKAVQVSSGLGFLCIKFKRRSLFARTFARKTKKILADLSGASDVIRNLMIPSIKENSLIMGMLLYNPDFTDKNTPGTVPLFWHPIKYRNLRALYFTDCFIMVLFNPVHLIIDVENLKFKVESKYTPKIPRENKPTPLHMLQQFDLFLSYIVNYLFTETSIIESIKQTLKINKERQVNKIAIRILQKVNTFQIKDKQ